jgi:hypothetical protein
MPDALLSTGPVNGRRSSEAETLVMIDNRRKGVDATIFVLSLSTISTNTLIKVEGRNLNKQDTQFVILLRIAYPVCCLCR